MKKVFKKITAVTIGLILTLTPSLNAWAETTSTGEISEDVIIETLDTDEQLMLNEGISDLTDDIPGEYEEGAIGAEPGLDETEAIEAEISDAGMPEIFEDVSDVDDTNENETVLKTEGTTYSNPKKNADGSVTYDCVWFGNYWQEDTDESEKATTTDQKLPVKWRVLSSTGDDLFLLADKILDAKPYNIELTSVTWETSTVRSWLNGYGAGSNTDNVDYLSNNFIDSAFTPAQKADIKNSFVNNSSDQCNPDRYTDAGNNTYDKLFLLSFKETITEAYGFSTDWYDYDKARCAKPTAFAKTNGAYSYSDMTSEYYGNGEWWLRSPGDDLKEASRVSDVGSSYGDHTVWYERYGVRPALHISPTSSFISPAGTVCSDGTMNEIPADGTEEEGGNGDVLPEDVPENGKIPYGLWIVGVEDKAYTGSKVTQSFRVYDGKKLLKKNADYTVSYKNNVNVYTIAEGEPGFSKKKAPSVTVTGKNNYDSKETVCFKILPQDISGTDFSSEDMTLAATKKKQTVKPSLYWKDKALDSKTDYTFNIYEASDTEFNNPLGKAIKNQGEYVILYSGKGNFTGTRNIRLKVTSEGTVVGKLKVGKIPAAVFTGNPITPEPKVSDGKKQLVKGTHYTLSYASNVGPGKGYVIITGNPEEGYTGIRRVSFNITAPKPAKVVPYDISPTKDTEGRINIRLSVSRPPYMKGGAKPSVTVTFRDYKGNTKTLEEGTDYKLTFKNNNVYNNAKKQPAVTVTGKNGFKGSRSMKFELSAKNINVVTLKAKDKVYKDKANVYTTKVELVDEDGAKLTAGKDYSKVLEYTYANRTEVKVKGNPVIREAEDSVGKNDIIPAGTVICVKATAIAGSGYTGTVTGTYRMTRYDISSAKVTIPAQTYTGKEITLNPNNIKVKVGKKTLEPYDPVTNPDGFVISGYSNNINKGTAKVTIKGTGNYGGLKTQPFKIKARIFEWWWRL